MKKKIVLILPNLSGGGAEKVMITLLKSINKYEDNCEVYLITINKTGPLVEQLSEDSKVISLGYDRIRNSPKSLIKVLNEIKPDSILSTLTSMNVLLLLIKPFLKGKPKLIIRETNPPSSKFTKRRTKVMYKILYRFADEIIAISDGVAKDLSDFASIKMKCITTIYNPIDIEEISIKSKVSSKNSWLEEKDKPVLIAIGRLVKQKDFETLIKSFNEVKKSIDCRLIILGEGIERQRLEKLSKDLNLDKDISFLGFVDNPYSFIVKSNLFVLSSKWEGFGLVLAESLALNVPIVSTNCNGAPREILENGKYGLLIEPGDYESMSKAIIQQLNNPINNNLNKRAQDFDIGKIVEKYLDVLV